VIQLGAFDTSVSGAMKDAYLKELEATTRVPLAEVVKGRDRIEFASHVPDADRPMTVAAVQKALKTLGFFPGGKEDGICGYRTVSAIRLFQEYVRSVEKIDCIPDGIFGAASQQHLTRWLNGHLSMEWAPTIEQWRSNTLGQTEYTAWLALLEQVKAKYMASPNRMLTMVNAFTRPSDTRKPANWDFSPQGIHLIGVRRHETKNRFDDIFVLLLKGLVFKFRGSTEPGKAKDPAAGAPFLVQGQHDYHFGWHKLTYLALRPQKHGVLVVRSKNDMQLDENDLANGLEVNGTINIHWGGQGLNEIKDWSEGCQVINSTAYIQPGNRLVNCSRFSAVNNTEFASVPGKTRAAYSVLVDLVTALGSDISAGSMRYTMLIEPDLDLSPTLKQGLADARTKLLT
jgi:hypothetical protein